MRFEIFDFNPETIVLGLDTETTGLPNKGIPANDPKQARVVQLALKLVTLSGRVISQFSTLIEPSGWDEIHPKAFEAHGITREDCERFGMPARDAFDMFWEWAMKADVIVAHDVDFDSVLMMIEADALNTEMPEKPWYCTMKEATKVCKIPPTAAMQRAGRHHHKSANLGEALQILCGKELVGAHDAMVDVTGAIEVLIALRQRKAA